MKRCLYCYEPLSKNEIDFHASCCKKIFGQTTPPELPYTESQMEELALQVVKSQTTLTGVQAKLSLELTPNKKGEGKRFKACGLKV